MFQSMFSSMFSSMFTRDRWVIFFHISMLHIYFKVVLPQTGSFALQRMAGGGEHAEVFGDVANLVEHPENGLTDDTSFDSTFYDECLANSKPVSKRKISILWRNINHHITVKNAGKTIAQPNSSSVCNALVKPKKGNKKHFATNEDYLAIIRANASDTLTLHCILFVAQLEITRRINDALRGAMDSDVGLERVIGTDPVGLRAEAAAQNISYGTAAMNRVMTTAQDNQNDAAIENIDRQYKEMLHAAQLVAQRNPNDPRAAEHAMAGMITSMSDQDNAVESCQDDAFFLTATFEMLKRYKMELAKDFNPANFSMVRYKMKKIAERATVLIDSGAHASSGPGVVKDSIANLLDAELTSLQISENPRCDSARHRYAQAHQIPGHGTAGGQNMDANRLRDMFPDEDYQTPCGKEPNSIVKSPSIHIEINDDEDSVPPPKSQTRDVNDLMENLDALHEQFQFYNLYNNAYPTQMREALASNEGDTKAAMMQLHIMDRMPMVRNFDLAGQIMRMMDSDVAKVDKVAACFDHVLESCEVGCITFICQADPAFTVERVHVVLQALALQASKKMPLKRQVSDYNQVGNLSKRTGCNELDTLRAALKANPFDLNAADVFVRVCMEAGDTVQYNCVEIAIKTFNSLPMAIQIQNASYGFKACLSMLANNLKPFVPSPTTLQQPPVKVNWTFM